MTNAMRPILAFLLLALALPSAAQNTAPTTHAGTGYEITLPAGWAVATEQDKSALRGETAKLFPNVQQINLSMIDMFGFDTASGAAFATNVNVVRIPDTLSMTDRNRKDYEASIRQELGRAGINLKSMVSRIDTIGNAACITTEMHTRIMGNDLFQRGHLFSDGKQSYIITFSSLKSEQAKYEPVFDQMLASFKSSSGTLKGKASLSGMMMPVLIGLAVVAGIVVLVVVKASASKARKRAARRERLERARGM